MADAGEQGTISKILRWVGPSPNGEVWIGDDAACVPSPPGTLLLAADTVVEGVHCDLRFVSLQDMGWKAVASNVSDIAAMGGRPLHILCSVAGPPNTNLEQLYKGIIAAAAQYGVAIVGGDLSNAPTLVISVSITGIVSEGQPVLRSNAQVGDTIMVTGPLGSSAAGLSLLSKRFASSEGSAPILNQPEVESSNQFMDDKSEPGEFESALISAHLRPIARLEEGLAARRAGATAMIDVSDGLAIDLDRLATASGVGIALDSVPTARGASESDATAGGEDYELVFTTPSSEQVQKAFRKCGLRIPIAIGTITAREGERLLRGRTFAADGWQHQWG